MISKNFYKHLVSVQLLFITAICGFAQPYNPQVSTTNQGSGNVLYTTSNCSDHALRFFIFGDGYYSFENNPTHHYPQSGNGYTAKVWFSEPYDPGDPILRNAPSSGSTQSGPNINPEIDMPTNPMIGKSWSLVQNKEHFYMLVFRNTGNTPYSGCIEFHYKTTDLLLNTNGILQYNNWVFNRIVTASNEPEFNKMIKWNFSNLGPGETRVVYIPMKVLQPIDAIINTASRVSVNCSGSSPLVVQQNDVRATPHDPNYKSVDRYFSNISNPFIPPSFTYKIHFKNIGSGYANTVVVTDQLSDKFDINTLQNVTAEYPFVKTLNGNLLTFTFPNINLPGTKQTVPYIFEESKTESWIQFTICTQNVLLEQTISNDATIYFDSQPGMATNKAIITLNNVGSIVNCGGFSGRMAGTTKAEDVTISPNPVNGLATLNAYSAQPTEVNIYTSNGALIRKLNYDRLEGETYIDMSEMPIGLYLIKIKSTELNVTLKVIKQ